MFFPHNASDQSISVFFNGRMCSVPASDNHFAELREHLAQPVHDYETVERMIDKPKMVSRLSEGLVTVVGSTVMYKGQPVHSTLTYRLLELLDAGENAIIWARFLERVMANPSDRSRECLYDFLNAWKAPITEDGHFIAFKRVRPDYRDIHSGTFDNSPGQVVEMPRDRVNADPDVSCSNGLHVAATSYLGSFYSSYEGYRVLACKVDPADVVAVPRDYGFAKMRVCRYVVLGDAEESFYKNAESQPVSYAGTEAATGAVIDPKGQPICYNAVDFAENWKRDAKIEIDEGVLVSPSAASNSENLPKNRFIVGTVISIEQFDPSEMDDDAFDDLELAGIDASDIDDVFMVAEVEWQDGTESEDLLLIPGKPMDSDLVGVEFIGEKEELPADEDEDDSEDKVCPECGDYKADWQFICEDCEEEDDDTPYCGECGNVEVDFEDEICDACEAEEERLAEEDWNNVVDAVDEADHIDETGCTRDGVPVGEDYGDPYSHGHSVERFTEVEDEIDDQPSEMAFERAGVTYTASQIKAGIRSNGQRGYSRLTGIPRTTLQDWMTKIEACED
ncbi:rIIB lysis inhibitor [Phaeobacter phage MD18]|nr:rIIB lysis inhibitor [Phaeobacter phage MD18]